MIVSGFVFWGTIDESDQVKESVRLVRASKVSEDIGLKDGKGKELTIIIGYKVLPVGLDDL